MSIGDQTGQEDFAQIHARILRKYISDGRSQGADARPSVGDLANRIKAHPRTLKAWKLGHHAPLDRRFLNLARALGPHYVNDVLRHAGYGNATPIRFDTAQAINGNQAQYELAMRMQSLASAMLDGFIDHVERESLIVEFDHLVAMMNLFVWGLRNAAQSPMPGGISVQPTAKDIAHEQPR